MSAITEARRLLGACPDEGLDDAAARVVRERAALMRVAACALAHAERPDVDRDGHEELARVARDAIYLATERLAVRRD